jgi:histidyl-tRNA synthetase
VARPGPGRRAAGHQQPGPADERRAHRAALIAHFEAHREQLDADAKRRLHSNPLRILDTRTRPCRRWSRPRPAAADFLGEASLKHFDAVRAVLDAAGQPYRINPRLVRGMDYYNLTVFEWVTDQARRAGHDLRRRPLRRPDRADRRQAGAGGRLGHGHRAGARPAGGVRHGARRCRPPHAYAVCPAAALPRRWPLIEALRAAGVSVLMHAGKDSWGSMKSQFKKADASGARHALIFGADELARGEVAVKPLRDAARPAQRTPLADAAAGRPTCSTHNRDFPATPPWPHNSTCKSRNNSTP